jgi:hypothetical protein
LIVMRVRLFELRLLAVTLTGLWTIAAGLVLLGYRPGGPIDLLVGVAATLPIAISVAAVIWPPAVRSSRGFAGVACIGLGAALLLVPSIGGILGQLVARGPQTLLPSLEAAYPWVLALAATSVFAGLGIARAILGQTSMRRRRLELGLVLAVVFTLLSGTLFAGAAIANELALRNLPATTSRFGPTIADDEPPQCGDPIAVASSAQLQIDLTSDVDGHQIGSVEIHGTRSGQDVRQLDQVATDQAQGQYGFARIGERAWTKQPGGQWRTDPEAMGSGPVLDELVLETALLPDNRTAAEERGIEFVEGARARHCRIAVDGPRFAAAFPDVSWFGTHLDLHRWRGQVDYWLFLDGELGQVVASVNGEAIGLGRPGLLATIHVTLTATDRDLPTSIDAPVP